MAEISAIIVTVVVAVLAVLLWRLVRAIERREAQFDRRGLIGVINNSSRRYGRCTT
jgi:hypothetical protein